MAFTQFKLDRSVLQARGIFNKYIYETTDTIAEVTTANYFADSRFITTDNDETNGMGWSGGIMECSCSDGYIVGQISVDGLSLTNALPSGSDIISTLLDGQVPKYDSGSDTLIYSGATVDSDNKWTFDETAEFPSGSISLSDVITLSEAGTELFSHEFVLGNSAVAVQSIIDDTGTSQPFLQAANNDRTSTAQPVFDTTITTNPIVLPTLSSTDVQTNTFVLKANGAMTNVRLTLTDTATGLILKYIPNKIAVTSGTGGLDFVAGDVTINLNSDDADTVDTFNLGFTPLRSLAGRLGSILIEADNMDLLGNSSGIPYVQNQLQSLSVRPVAFVRDASNLSDNYTRLNNNYTTAAGTTSGLVVNYEATATADTVTLGQFTDGEAAVSNPTVITDGSDTFAQNDIIQVSGTKYNDGFFEVEDHTGTTLTIRGVGTVATVEDFSLTQFDSAEDSGAITKVNVSIIRSATDGNWEEGKGSVTPITYHELGTDTDINIYNQDGAIDEDRTVDVEDGHNLSLNAYDKDAGSFDFLGQVSIQDDRVSIDIQDNLNNLQTMVDVQQATAEISSKDLTLGTEQTLEVHNSGQEAVFTDSVLEQGLQYPTGHSYTFTGPNLVDKDYVDGELGNADNIYNSDGTISAPRSVSIDPGNFLSISSTDVGVEQSSIVVEEADITLSNTDLSALETSKIEISTSGGIVITDDKQLGGALYAADYSSDYVPRSLVDKGYVDSILHPEVIIEGDNVDNTLYIGDGLPTIYGESVTVTGYGTCVTDDVGASEISGYGYNVAPNLPTGSSDRLALYGSNILTGLTLGSDRVNIFGSNNHLSSIENCSFINIFGDSNLTSATGIEDIAIFGRDSLKNATNLTRVTTLGNDIGNSTSGALTDVTLVGHGAQAPGGTTDNYLNISNIIHADTSSPYVAISTTTAKPTGPALLTVEGATQVVGQLGVGDDFTPERAIHLQSSNAIMRIDRGQNSPGLQIFRFSDNTFSTVWKGFQMVVDGSGVNDGSFCIGDRGTATSGAAVDRLRINNDGSVDIFKSLSVGSLIRGTTRTAVSADFDSESARMGVTDVTAARTITILSADIAVVDREFDVIDESGDVNGTDRTITIETEGSETIAGGASIEITSSYSGVNLYSDGSNLFIR